MASLLPVVKEVRLLFIKKKYRNEGDTNWF